MSAPQPKRRRRKAPEVTAAQSVLSLHAVTVGIRNAAQAWWAEESFGPFDAPWQGGETADRRRLVYLCALAARHIDRISRGEWSVQPDRRDDPSVLLLGRKGDLGMLALNVHGGVVTIGDVKLKLGQPGVSLQVLDHLARKIARFFVGTPGHVS